MITHTQQKEIHHTYILKYPLQVSDHTHTTERDTPYLHTEIPTTSQWSHTQHKEIHHTYILKYPLQVSDHTHNTKRYTIPTCWNTHYKSVIIHTHNSKRYTIPTYWNTHYKSVITHTTERDTPYLHTEIPTTSKWSHTQQKEIHHTYILKYPLQVSDHTQQKEIHHTYMLKYTLQVSDHIHNRKRYTIATYWNTHYKSVITHTHTTEGDTPYLRAAQHNNAHHNNRMRSHIWMQYAMQIVSDSCWPTYNSRITTLYLAHTLPALAIWHMCSEVSKLEQHDLQVHSQDWPKGGVLISNMGIRQGPLQNKGGCFSTPRPPWPRPWSFNSGHKCTLTNRFTQYPGLLQLCGLHNPNRFFPKKCYCNVNLPLENRRAVFQEVQLDQCTCHAVHHESCM